MTCLARPLSLVLLALLAVACSTPEERTAEYTAKAKSLYEAGNYDKARVEARNAVQIAPKNAEARYLLALIAEKKGEVGQMLEQLSVVIEEDPKNAAAKVKLGTLMIYAQDYAGAALLADEAFALTPDDPGVHVLKARVALQKEDLPATLAALDRALELDPKNVEAAALRAVAGALKEPEKALDELNAAIGRVGAADAEPLRQMKVDLLSRLGRNDEVEKELRALIADFGGERYTTNTALFLTSQKRYDEAEQVLRDAIKANPAAVAPKVALAQFQSKYRQQPEEAEKTLKRFIAEEPDNAELAVYLGNFYEAGNRTAEAMAAYEKAADSDPESEQGLIARNRIAALKLRGGDVAGAEKLLAGILEDQPDNVSALLTRGEINTAAGRSDDAIADFRGVLRREPENQLALLLMAKTHIAVGDSPLAEDAYRRVLQINPRNTEAMTALASLVGGTGRLDEAEKLLKDALAVDAKLPAALEALVGVNIARKDLKAAEATARALVEAQPGSDVGQRELGRVLEAAGNSAGALAAYKAALDLKNDSTLALEGVVRVLQSSGQLPAATTFLEEHLEAHPDHVLARVLLGGNLLRRGNLEAARTALEQAIDQQPSLVRAYMVLASAWPQDAAKRIEVLQRGLKANPKAGTVAILLASEHQRAGRVDDAIAVYEQAIKDMPTAPNIANNLAALLLDFRTDEASYKRALELAGRFANSKQPMYLDTLGWAHYRNKDYDSAIRFLELAIAFGGKEPIARYHLGLAYLATDNLVGAKQELEKSIEGVDPREPWVGPARKALADIAAKPAAAGQG